MSPSAHVAHPSTPDFVSDADRLANGNILIDNGGIEFPHYRTRLIDNGGIDFRYYRTRLIEVVPSDQSGGEIVSDMRIGSERYGVVSYRAARIDSFCVGDDWVDAPC